MRVWSEGTVTTGGVVSPVVSAGIVTAVTPVVPPYVLSGEPDQSSDQTISYAPATQSAGIVYWCWEFSATG